MEEMSELVKLRYQKMSLSPADEINKGNSLKNTARHGFSAFEFYSLVIYGSDLL